MIGLLLMASLTLQAQSDKKILSASSHNKPATAKELAAAQKKHPWDTKAPHMILFLEKPTLEVLTHTMRILVSCKAGVFHLKGKAQDKVSGVKAVFVGEKRVNLDQTGRFETYIPLTQAYTVVKVVALDKSGNEKVKELAIKRTTPLVEADNDLMGGSNEAEHWVAPEKKNK